MQAKLSSQKSEFEKLEKAQRDNQSRHATELSALQAKVGELETLRKHYSAQEDQLKSLSGEKRAADEKYTQQISTMQSRINNIETANKEMAGQLQSRQSEYDKLVAAEKASREKYEKELAAVQSRVKTLEPLQQQLNAKTAELESLRSAQKAASDKQVAEIQSLQSRVRELEPLKKQLADGQAANDTLQRKVQSLEPLQSRLESQQKAFDELQRTHKSATDKLAGEQAELKKQLQQREQLNGQIRTLQQQLSDAEAVKAEVGKKQAEIAQLNKRIADARSEADQGRQQIAQLSRQIDAGKNEIQGLRSSAGRIPELERQLQSAQKTGADKQQELEKLKQQLATLEQSMARSHTENEKSKEELKAALNKAQAQLGDYDSLKAQKEKQQAVAEQAEVTLTELRARLNSQAGIERRLAELEQQLKSRVELHTDDVNQRDREILDLKLQIEKLKARQQVPQVQPAVSQPRRERAAVTADGKKTIRKDGMDDLKLIFGIGPKIEKLLNQNGVRHFEDIAGWSEADIQKYSDMLGSFPDRIERDEWVLSAKQIIAGTYNWTERKKSRGRSDA